MSPPRTPLRLLGSRQHLHEILVNLVGNAVKFTREGGVTIAVDGEPQEDGSVRLTMEITDTGIGIAPKDQERIFEDFTQANPGIMNRFGGTGLGLAIARRLVELLGGSISVESMLGEGSTFRFDIARRDAAGRGAGRRGSRGASGASSWSAAMPAPLTDLVDTLVRARRHAHDRRSAPGAGAHVPAAVHATPFAWSSSPDGANLPLPALGPRGAASKVVLIQPGAAPTMPALATRRRSASLLSEHPTAPELRHALTIACRLSAPSHPRPAGAACPLPMRRPRRVLLADDNRINQRVFSRILEAAGHSVRSGGDRRPGARPAGGKGRISSTSC